MSRFIILSTTVLLGVLTFTCLDAAPEEGEMITQPAGAGSCTRELWRVLFGAGAGLVALLVSSYSWEGCFIHSNTENHGGDILFKFVLVLIRVLSPQVYVPKASTAGYAAIMMRHRLKKMSPTISKRLCPMVVWLGIDENTYASFFGRQGWTSKLESSNMAGSNDTAPVALDPEGHGFESVKSNTAGIYEGAGPVIADNEKATVQEYFKHAQRLRSAPNLRVAVPWPGSKLPPAAHEGEQPYFICLQGWDRKTIMWKEVLVLKGALGSVQNISEWMRMVTVMPWWARALVVVLGSGYEASILSRFAHHLRVSSLELICSWIWLLVVVEAGIVPLVVIPSYQGIHLRLDRTQFHEVVQEYIKRAEEQTHLALTCIDVWTFVLCILYMFALFLIVNPPLVYYYYKLPTSILSFVSLILFAILAGAGIVTFALMLFYPPHYVLLAFSHLWKPPSSPCMFAITILLLLSGLASYILAVTDTTMNWALFQAQDHSFFSFMIPHIGS